MSEQTQAEVEAAAEILRTLLPKIGIDLWGISSYQFIPVVKAGLEAAAKARALTPP